MTSPYPLPAAPEGLPEPRPKTPAARIINTLGGVKRAAFLAGRSEKAVYRWLASPATGGTGGAVPPRAQRALVANVEAGLTFSDFLPADGEAFL